MSDKPAEGQSALRLSWPEGHDEKKVKPMQISEYFFKEIFPFSKDQYHSRLNEYLKENLKSLEVTQTMIQALTHKSFSHEVGQVLLDNERLEFLGDSVLQLLISENLLRVFPKENEGTLSKLRSAIVNENTLAKFFELYKINSFILLGRGELKEKGHEKKSISANTFEAILGAIYTDSGIDDCRMFLSETIKKYEAKYGLSFWSLELLDEFDPKTRLQEKMMKKFKITPSYICNEVEKGFDVSLVINGELLGKVTSNSKKDGMQELARKILKENLI